MEGVALYHGLFRDDIPSRLHACAYQTVACVKGYELYVQLLFPAFYLVGLEERQAANAAKDDFPIGFHARYAF